jgi:hypothetical protein
MIQTVRQVKEDEFQPKLDGAVAYIISETMERFYGRSEFKGGDHP